MRLLNRIEHYIRGRQERKVLALLERLEGHSNLVEHARSELKAKLAPGADVMDRRMAEHLVAMCQLFAMEGHSGFSAGIATSWLQPLLKFEPLGPLTGEDHEWMMVYREEDGTPVLQNTRCGRVFKRKGEAYDCEGRVFRDPDGVCFINLNSRVVITFPYEPKTEYVDVDLEGNPV